MRCKRMPRHCRRTRTGAVFVELLLRPRECREAILIPAAGQVIHKRLILATVKPDKTSGGIQLILPLTSILTRSPAAVVPGSTCGLAWNKSSVLCSALDNPQACTNSCTRMTLITFTPTARIPRGVFTCGWLGRNMKAFSASPVREKSRVLPCIRAPSNESDICAPP